MMYTIKDVETVVNEVLGLEEQVNEIVYNNDNFSNYYEAYNLVFTGWNSYKGINTTIDILETLERAGETDLKQFYIDLFNAMDIEEEDYKISIEDFLTYNDLFSNVRYTKKFTIWNFIDLACHDFKFIFYKAFNPQNFSFDLDRISWEDATEVNYYTWDFFAKYSDLLNGLLCDDKLESIIMDIVYKVDSAMNIEYLETLYSLENEEQDF